MTPRGYHRAPNGATGLTGQTGQPGSPGISPIVTALPADSSDCNGNGGDAITDAADNTTFVCNGAQGPAGPSGISVVMASGSTNVQPGNDGYALAQCPANYPDVLAGAAWSTLDNGSGALPVFNDNPDVNSSGQLDGWDGAVNNPSSSTAVAQLDVYALCTSAPN